MLYMEPMGLQIAASDTSNWTVSHLQKFPTLKIQLISWDYSDISPPMLEN